LRCRSATRAGDRKRGDMGEPDVYYDPYDREIDADPYPVYRRLREERRSTTTSRTTSGR